MALIAPTRSVAKRGLDRPTGPPELDGLAVVHVLTDAWRAASAATTWSDTLAVLAEAAAAAVGALSAAITILDHGVVTASPDPMLAVPLSMAPPRRPREYACAITSRTGETLGALHVRFGSAREISAQAQGLLMAFGEMASVLVERDAGQRNLRAVLDHSPAAIFLKDRQLRYVVANRRAAEMMGLTTAAELIGRRDDELLPAEDAERLMTSDRSILAGEGDLDEEQDAHWPLEGRQFLVNAFQVRDDAGVGIGVGGVISDITDHRTAEIALAVSERRYHDLFTHALDGIVMADDDGRYIEANPAACEILGLSRAEVLQRSVSDLVIQSGGGHVSETGERFRTGDPDPGEVPSNRGYVLMRRADGRIREVEISAVPNIAPGVHLSVLRDATSRRQSERQALHRRAVIDALDKMPADASLAGLASAACAAIVEAGGFPEVAILAVEPPARFAIVGAAVSPATLAAGLPPVVEGARAAAIITKAESGPWVDDWSDADGRPSESLLVGVPIAAVGWAPIRADGRLTALLAVAGTSSAPEQRRQLTELGDLASIIAGSALGHALRERAAVAASRERIQTILADHAFRPVFQPIVDLASGQALGYEALTRFRDGTPPDLVFAEAAAAGLSIELEVATAQAALLAAAPLPANRFININVSPELILAREPLRSMLRDWGFGVVLEITEHTAVSDYGAVREAIAKIGNHVQLAVDDAGSGFASLRHILELRPAMVKLDITLIRDIDSDPARQALVAGLVHFASRLDFALLAEGVETEAERATLLELGVTRAQGWLFGRAAPAVELVKHGR